MSNRKKSPERKHIIILNDAFDLSPLYRCATCKIRISSRKLSVLSGGEDADFSDDYTGTTCPECHIGKLRYSGKTKNVKYLKTPGYRIGRKRLALKDIRWIADDVERERSRIEAAREIIRMFRRES